MEEIWKDIDGFEGLYQVSNLGNVKSLDYSKRGYAKNLTPKENDHGYLWIELRKDGNKKQVLIHRLVALAFIPNPEPDKRPIVNHKDENPKNNTVGNLEWCNNSYNVRYSIARRKPSTRAAWRVSNSKYSKLAIIQKTIDGETIRKFPNIAAAVRELGYNNTSITECCKGIRKTAYGYRWEFAE